MWAFPVDCLKFKLKFGLRSYFFYFSLLLFKTLTSDSLFSTLFYLNIHYFFIFLLFPQLPKYLPFPFSSSISLYSVVYPLPLFFFFFPHHPRTTSFLFLLSFLFFPHHPRTPLPFFLLLPHSNLSKKNSKFTNFHSNITENNSKFTNFHSNITKKYQNQTSTSKQNHTQTITITDLKKKKKQQKKPRKKKKEKRERQ